MGFKKLHTTSCIISTCSGYKCRNNKYMHSYSVMCDKDHRNNSIRGRNICDEVYIESYNVCVTKLKNDNKISVNVAGYSICALLDAGSTISKNNLVNNIESKLTTINLNPRVEQIHLADSGVSEEQKEQLIRIMNTYEMCFANNLMELGRTSVLEYDIETVPDIKPIRMKPYSCPYKHKERIYQDIEKLKEADLIRPAKMSQWVFPTVLVNKPHYNKMRMCNDVRKLNDKTILQPYPMLNRNYLLADIGKRQ